MLETVLNLLIIWALVFVSVISLINFNRNQEISRKAIGVIWIFLAFLPLTAALINSITLNKSFLADFIIYTILAIPIAIPAIFLMKGINKSLSVILAYSWIGLSITGIFFLLFTLGTPLIIIEYLRGRCSFPDILPGIIAGELWTTAALFIFGTSIYIIKKIIKLAKKNNVRTLKIIFLLFTGMLFCSGCTSTPYLVDRGRDAMDVFTATGSVGFGGRARFGPLSGGLYMGIVDAGLLGGQIGKFSAPASPVIPTTLEFTLSSFEELYRKDSPQLNRGKLYESGGFLTFSTAETHSEKRNYDNYKICWPYYTQIEVIAGFGGGVRLGFNIGEFLDFILGWGIIDIYGDDIGIIKQTEKKSDDAVSAKTDSKPK